MDPRLRALVDEALDGVRQDDQGSWAGRVLVELLKRYRVEQAGFEKSVVDSDLGAIYGEDIRAIRVDSDDVADIVNRLSVLLESGTQFGSLACALLHASEDEVAVPAIIEQLSRLEVPLSAGQSFELAGLLAGLRPFLLRPDVVAALTRLVDSPWPMGEEAQRLLDSASHG